MTRENDGNDNFISVIEKYKVKTIKKNEMKRTKHALNVQIQADTQENCNLLTDEA